MNRKNILLGIIGIVILYALCYFISADGIKFHRPNSFPCDENKSVKCDSSSFIYLEKSPKNTGAKLAFIEFNEEGELYNSTVTDKTLNLISESISSSSRNSLIVAYVHGWHHNASSTDSNVNSFKKLLIQLQNQENEIYHQDSIIGQARDVIGLYLGWQGKVTENPILDYLSYKSRKEVAIRTGEAGVKKIIDKIIEIRHSSKHHRLVLIGHSFGAGALYSAINSNLIKSIQLEETIENSKLADLSILLNPAIEAEKFELLYNLVDSKRETFNKNQSLLLASFTSTGDKALSELFPLAMKVSYLNKVYENKERKAIGFYSPFKTHSLAMLGSINDNINIGRSTFNKGVGSWIKFRNSNCLDFKFDKIVLAKKDKKGCFASPFINVLVDRNLINDHDSIWNPDFAYFIRGLIGMEFSSQTN